MNFFIGIHHTLFSFVTCVINQSKATMHKKHNEVQNIIQFIDFNLARVSKNAIQLLN